MAISMEQWKKIVLDGEEWDYEVSNYGRVRNSKTLHVLKMRVGSDGYFNTTIRKDGKLKTVSNHRLVALMFLENKDNLPYVNHKDENKLNCHVDNLEWCTAQYNTQYSKHKVKGQKRENCKGYRGVNVVTGEIIEYYSISELEEVGFNYNKVMQNIGGRNNHYKGYKWEKIW